MDKYVWQQKRVAWMHEPSDISCARPVPVDRQSGACMHGYLAARVARLAEWCTVVLWLIEPLNSANSC